MTIRRDLDAEGTNWRDDLAGLRAALLSGAMDRRTFLEALAAIVALAAGCTAPVYGPADDPAYAGNSAAADPDEEPWRTLAAVQSHLFPSGGEGPGADEIRAAAYLRSAMEQPDMNPNSRDFIRHGVDWLNDVARERHQANFVDLAEQQREAILQHVAASNEGERWIALLLLYLFEALLSDPVYGGNPDGIGWRWLEHTPGFPRPPADHTYPALSRRRSG